MTETAPVVPIEWRVSRAGFPLPLYRYQPYSDASNGLLMDSSFDTAALSCCAVSDGKGMHTEIATSVARGQATPSMMACMHPGSAARQGAALQISPP